MHVNQLGEVGDTVVAEEMVVGGRVDTRARATDVVLARSLVVVSSVTRSGDHVVRARLLAGLATNSTAVGVLGVDGHSIGVVGVEGASSGRARLLTRLEDRVAAEESRVNTLLANNPGEGSCLVGSQSSNGNAGEHLDRQRITRN